jgi:ATP-dependent DNA helicase RecQ
LPRIETFHALQKLEQAGVIQLSESVYQVSRLRFLIQHDELYRFQVANQKFDPLIKSLLRMYGGELYTQYVNLKEKELARILNSGPAQIRQWLETLDQQEIVHYVKSSDQPQIVFSLPRREVHSLPLDKQLLKWRREVSLNKVASMVAYARELHQCRTRIFQHYFDDESENNCGICDYCVQRHQPKEAPPSSTVLTAIPDEGIYIHQLAQKVKASDEEVMHSLRELLDQEKIYFYRHQWVKKVQKKEAGAS